MTMDSQELQEHRDRLYRTIVQSTAFVSQLKTFNTYSSNNNTNQQLQVIQESGAYVLFGMLKIYWGTQKVIRLKKEELSWKRKSTRISYENGPDEKLMSAMGSGAKNRRSLTKLEDHDESGSQDAEDSKRYMQRSSIGSMDCWNGIEMTKNTEDVGDEGDREEDGEIMGGNALSQKGQFLTTPRKCSLQRRTMSFSGHLYNSKTAVFRPKYGTISNVRVSSKLTTCEVIGLLLKKFAVENHPDEFNLYWVQQNGETHAFHLNDFPLLKRVQLGPDENVAKIFIKEKKSDEISLEVAGYVNLRVPELEAILRKFHEEEEKEVLKIKQRYVQYRTNLCKKLEILAAEIDKEAKSKGKRKAKEKKKGKGKGKGKK